MKSPLDVVGMETDYVISWSTTSLGWVGAASCEKEEKLTNKLGDKAKTSWVQQLLIIHKDVGEDRPIQGRKETPPPIIFLSFVCFETLLYYE